MSRKNYVIIGDGGAGLTAAQHIRQSDPTGVIHIYSDDPNAAYYRAALTNYLIGELREEQLWAVPPTFFAELNIRRKLDRVVSIDPKRGLLHLSSSKSAVEFDQLLIGSGSRSRPPVFPGANLNGVMTMRTMRDVRKVMDLVQAKSIQRAVIIGGGPLGLEWAAGLRERGCEVSVLLRGTKFMENVLDDTGSDLLLARLRQSGVDVVLEDEVEEAIGDNSGKLKSIRTKKGKTITCQMVGAAIGVICNTEFLEGSNLELSKRKAILVNERMETNIAGIYGAGDVCEWQGEMLQLWEPARFQGRVAGVNMAGGNDAYTPGTHYIATRLYDLDFASVGEIKDHTNVEEIIDFPKDTGYFAYRKLVLKDDVLVGALLLGERKEKVRARGRLFRNVIDQKLNVGEIKELLFDPLFNLQGWFQGKAIKQSPSVVRSSAVFRPPKSEMQRKLNLESPGGRPSRLSAPDGALLVAAQDKAEFPLKPTFRIGRGEDNDLVLTDHTVSHTHALISAQEGQYYLHDLESTNGTFVRDEELKSPRALHSGDQVRFGNIKFSYKIPGQSFEIQPRLKTVGFSTIQLSRSQLVAEKVSEYVQLNNVRLPLEKDIITFGRDQDADVFIDDPAVSFKHAQITKFQGQAYLFDLGSTNGTWLNGKIASEPVALESGNSILIGNTEITFFKEEGARPIHNTPQEHQNAHDKFCRFCGSAIQSTDTFCAQCGKTVSDANVESIVEDAEISKPARGFLILHEKSQQEERLEIESKLIVGRNSDLCGLVIQDASVSNQHFEIKKRAKKFVLRDLGSQNGTFVNGERISRSHHLRSGDKIVLGRDHTILFEEETA